MPHDRNSKPLQPGDRVLVPCTVASVCLGEEWCNVTLKTQLPAYPSQTLSTIVLNARQVEKVEA